MRVHQKDWMGGWGRDLGGREEGRKIHCNNNNNNRLLLYKAKCSSKEVMAI
jgi:hypothetical protein